MGKFWGRFIESISPQKVALILSFLSVAAIFTIKFWDWIKYRIGIITAAMAVLSLDKWAVIIGIFCTVITCMVNWYYERKKYLIALEEATNDE
ncbi:HP1 family phage holin [Yokenella regensburgei]|uniref:HP1 family phage holin n=1 Tax=Yokenella regensburgei TaxID=158877 RepID=UPI0013754C23|nr:putative RND superfamily exporter protein [Yokenella regensburgei]